jgi:molecular chaperone DnaK
MIEKNTTIPVRKAETYSTAADNQPSVEIHVLQGERKMASDNRSLGKFQLADIPPSPRGVPQIEVTFDIDANGIMSISAKDKNTGKEQSIRIEASSGLSDAEIANMKADAEENAEADTKKKEDAEKINQADAIIFQTEKQLSEYGDKIPEEKRAPIDEALAELKKAHGEKDMDAIETSMEKLNTVFQAASEDMYAQAGEEGAQAEGEGQGAESSETENAEDVDFEEVDEEQQKD